MSNNQANFDRIVKFAKDVINSYEDKSTMHKNKRYMAETHPIIDVIRLLGRKIQTEYLMNLLYCDEESPLVKLNHSTVLFDTRYPITKEGKFFRELVKELDIKKEIVLAKDLILPWPWQRDRLINSITNIGRGRIAGEWRQHHNNHYVELWLPMGIAWVSGGNHSISTGIIQGSGSVQPTSIVDISNIFNHIYTDGMNYYRKSDHQIISPVINIEFAAIFEIGRIMKDNSICF